MTVEITKRGVLALNILKYIYENTGKKRYEIANDFNISLEIIDYVIVRLKKKYLIRGIGGCCGGYSVPFLEHEIKIVDILSIFGDEIKNTILVTKNLSELTLKDWTIV